MTRDNTNSGTLGKNTRRESDRHPEYTGKLNVEGREYWLNAWVKTNGQTGERFFSLSVRPKEGGGGTANAPATAEQPKGGDFDDDIPF